MTTPELKELTPQSILSKTFTATQLKRGYSEVEVDNFLDDVAVEMRRLIAENNDLRQLASDTKVSPSYTMPAPKPVAESSALLAMAQKVHDQHVADGQNIREKLRSEGQALLNENRAAVEQSHRQDKQLISDTRERVAGMVAVAKQQRDLLHAEITSLQVTKADVTEGLKRYLQEQIKALDTTKLEYV